MPVIVIELVLVLGGAIAFAWWQLRDLDRERARRERERPASPEDDSPGSAGRH